MRYALDTCAGFPVAALGEPEYHLSCAGILVSHLQDGVVDHEVWLPMGEAPTFADNEALVAALRTAMRWNRGELPEYLTAVTSARQTTARLLLSSLKIGRCGVQREVR
jgi:hypothetical protein